MLLQNNAQILTQTQSIAPVANSGPSTQSHGVAPDWFKNAASQNNAHEQHVQSRRQEPLFQLAFVSLTAAKFSCYLY
jgi:hypothetical protein